MVIQNTAIPKEELFEKVSSLPPKIYQLYLPTSTQKYYLGLKRFFDILMSAVALILLSPLLIISAAAIKLDSKGPVLFKQERIGKNRKKFVVYKFRSMFLFSPSNIATAQLTDAEQYITRVGKFLRRTSIDELPQLINIIKGDMSIIGPRPLIPAEKGIHSMRYQQGVYFLRPGLAGLAQINGRDLVSPEEKAGFDTEYLHTFSLKTDLKIILKTIQVVFSHKGYVEGKQD